MTPADQSVAARVRQLMSGKLDFDSYARQLLEIADLSEPELGLHEDAAERIMSLRRRLHVLEARLRELEAHR